MVLSSHFLSFAEWTVLFSFLVLLLLWMFREPGGFRSFGQLFGKSLLALSASVADDTTESPTVRDSKVTSSSANGDPYYTDATSAMLICIFLFLMPSEMPDFFCTKSRDRSSSPQKRGSLMDWHSMSEKFPWSVVLLLGGGFALAAGVKESGLSAVVGRTLEGLNFLGVLQIQLIVAVFTMAFSNICSNTVTASIFIPIVARLLVLPVVLGSSFAFALPVGTPSNAIVFASGLLSVGDMMKSGLLISVVSALLIVLNMQTYARLILPLGEFPDWANTTAA